MLFDVEPGEFLAEHIGVEFREQRLEVLDMDGATVLGRIAAGQDDMGGTSANRLTGQTGGVDGDGLGNAGGAETHTLIASELAAHSHDLNYGTNSGSNPGPRAVSNTVQDLSFTATTTGAGGNQPHNNVQPTIIVNYIVYLGSAPEQYVAENGTDSYVTEDGANNYVTE